MPLLTCVTEKLNVSKFMATTVLRSLIHNIVYKAPWLYIPTSLCIKVLPKYKKSIEGSGNA